MLRACALSLTTDLDSSSGLTWMTTLPMCLPWAMKRNAGSISSRSNTVVFRGRTAPVNVRPKNVSSTILRNFPSESRERVPKSGSNFTAFLWNSCYGMILFNESYWTILLFWYTRLFQISGLSEKSSSVTTETNATEHYFHVVSFTLQLWEWTHSVLPLKWKLLSGVLSCVYCTAQAIQILFK